jgi:hypothetical protein
MSTILMISARQGWVSAAIFLAIMAVRGGEVAHAQSADTGLALGPVRLTGDEPSYLRTLSSAFDIQGHRESPTSPEGSSATAISCST